MQISFPHSDPISAFLKRWELPILAAIVLLAGALRFYLLSQVPPGLHYDEAWSGVNAEQVMSTGQIQVFFPTNQGVDALIVYLTIAAIKLFGTTPWMIRIPEAAIGTLTIVAAWWMCAEMYGRRSAPPGSLPSQDEQVFGSLLGLGAALILAFLFWHVHFSRIAMMPILVPFFLCLSFGLLARALNTGSWPDFVLTGLALGVSMYTYKAGYAIPPMAALYAGYCALTQPGFLSRNWRNLALCFGVALIVYTPLIQYAIDHPNDYFLRFRSVTVDSRTTRGGPNVIENLPAVLGMFFVRGDVNDIYNLPGRPALDPFLAILFLAGLVRAGLGWRDARLGLLPVWLVLMSLPTLLSELAPAAGRAIGVTPVLVILCALGAVTLWELASRAGKRWLTILAPAALAAGLVFSVADNLVDYFGRYASLGTLYRTFDQGPLDMSNYVNALPPGLPVYLSPDIGNYYTIQYVARRPMRSFDGLQGMVYPPPGQEAMMLIVVPSDKPVLDALIKARPDARMVWTFQQGDGRNYARAVRLPASDHPAPPPDHPLDARLGDSIHLIGYSLSSARVRPGDKLTLTLFWQTGRPIPASYAVFTHLMVSNPAPGADPMVAGQDREPVGGSYTTDEWQPGETILDQHTITIPPGTPPGQYQLEAGMYLLTSLERLAAIGPDGARFQADSVPVTAVEVVAGP